MITTTIPTNLDFPNRGILERDAFVNAQETAQDLLAGAYTTALNQYATELNDTEADINLKAEQVANQAIDGGYSQAYINATFTPKILNTQTDKATPVDADLIPLSDSASSFGLKKLSWANIKTALDLIYLKLNGNQSINGSFASILSDCRVGINETAGAITSLNQSGTLWKDFSLFFGGNLIFKDASVDTERARINSSGTLVIAGGITSNAKNVITDDSKSLAANGYSKLSNGLIIQWGITTSATAQSEILVTLPIAFPTNLASVSVTAYQSSPSNDEWASFRGNNLSSFYAQRAFQTGTSTGGVLSWIAVGY